MVSALRSTLFAASIVGASGASAVMLTGICGFPTDASGNWHTGWYNTHGPDGGKNAYVVTGQNVSGAFVNSGNGAVTNIALDLSAPGDYTIFAYFDGEEILPGRDFWGLNLFFDGNGVSPGISAFGTPQYLGDQEPEFWANSGATLDLGAENTVFGAGSLVYQSGNTQVLLTRYATTADVFALDRVDNFSLGASGRNDHITVIGLHVVPEPGTFAVIGIGLAALLKKRKAQRT